MAVTQEQITAATDALALQRLQTQLQFEQGEAYKAELAAIAAYREAESAAAAEHRAAVLAHNEALQSIFSRQAAAAEAMFLAFRQQATAFDASERGQVMQKAFDQLITVYMKPSTATTPDGRLADVNADGDFLLKAVQRVMASYDALRTPA